MKKAIAAETLAVAVLGISFDFDIASVCDSILQSVRCHATSTEQLRRKTTSLPIHEAPPPPGGRSGLPGQRRELVR